MQTSNKRVNRTTWVLLFLIITALPLRAFAQLHDVLTPAQFEQNNKLCAAVRAGNLATVKRFLAAGWDVNLQGEFGQTALIWASFHRNLTMVKYLLDHGARPNGLMSGHAFYRKDATGGTALSFAIEHGDAQIVEALLAHHVDVEGVDDRNVRPLMLAIGSGNLALTKRLLEARANVESRDELGQTPLMYADRSVELTKLLLDRGAKVDAVDNNGRTALFSAYHSPAVMQLLLNKGAKTDAVDHIGYTTLMLGAEDPKAVRFLLDHGAAVNVTSRSGDTPLLRALGNPKSIQYLLEARANVEHLRTDAASGPGTALTVASNMGFVETVKLLLKYHANVNRRAEYGKTALMNAGNVATMRVLLDAGANVNLKNDFGWTALMWMAAQGDPARVQLLLSHGASRDAVGNSGETAFLAAVMSSNVATTRFLLQKGADPRARIQKDDPKQPVRKGDTALMLVRDDGERGLATLRLLLQHHPDVNAVNSRGQTALMGASDSNCFRIVKVLLAYGANITIRDKDGKTALSHALHSPYAISSEAALLLLRKGAKIDPADRQLVRQIQKEAQAR